MDIPHQVAAPPPASPALVVSVSQTGELTFVCDVAHYSRNLSFFTEEG